MRKIFLPCAVAFLAVASAACDLLGDRDSEPIVSEIDLSFADDERFSTKAGRSVSPLDTNAFIITIVSPSGVSIYHGPYCAAPQKIPASAGTYYINVVSEEFTTPAFDKPQWGDEQYVKVEAGKPMLVKLLCRQMNCGVRLDIDPAFITTYTDAALLLKSAGGSLAYSVREQRTAFFKPGSISLVMSRGAKDETILTRTVGQGEILCVKLVIPEGGSSGSESGTKADEGFRIQVDTTRNYISERVTLGGGNSDKGDEPGNALTIAQAKLSVGEEDVWVGGYIVGGDLSSKSINFEGPFSSATCLALGPKSNTNVRDNCLSVQLPAGDVREALNLVDNPQMLGRYVYLKGDIAASYFGLVGLKNVSEYVIK